MPQQARINPSSRAVVTACMLTIATAMMTMIPTGVNALEPAKNEAAAKPADQMDHSKMDGMSMTGDVDYDFAANMRKHHQMALVMSEAELKTGKNPQMRQMAKDIIAAQKKEIATFDKWIAAHGEPTTKAVPKP